MNHFNGYAWAIEGRGEQWFCGAMCAPFVHSSTPLRKRNTHITVWLHYPAIYSVIFRAAAAAATVVCCTVTMFMPGLPQAPSQDSTFHLFLTTDFTIR